MISDLQLAYAVKQPRGNELWQSIVDQLHRDIARYLAAVDTFRTYGCDPKYR